MAVEGNIAAVPQIGSAHRTKVFAAGFSTTDLTNQLQCYDHAPQVLEVFNDSDATESLVFTDYQGETHTWPIGGGERAPISIPVAEIAGTSGDNLVVYAYWWKAEGATLNTP